MIDLQKKRRVVETLEACPYCGSSGIIYNDYKEDGVTPWKYWVECGSGSDCEANSNCKACDTLKEAVDAWNFEATHD